MSENIHIIFCSRIVIFCFHLVNGLENLLIYVVTLHEVPNLEPLLLDNGALPTLQ